MRIIKSILVFFYSVFLFVAILNVIKEYRLKKIISVGVSFRLAFILYYILIPLIAIIIIEIHEQSLRGMLLRISHRSNIDLIYAFFFTVISYITFITFNQFKFSKETEDIYKQKHRFIGDSISSSNKAYKISFLLGITCLLIGLFTQILIVDSLGGIVNTAKMGDKLRAYGVSSNNYIPQNRLFAITLMPITLASPYFFLYAQRIKKKFSIELFLLVSIFSSILYFLINAGRIAILIFILTFFIDFSFRKSQHPFILIIIATLVLLFLIGELNDLFFYLSYGFVKESNTGLVSIVNEFAFPYLNLVNITEINTKYDLRYGIDFVTWIINIIPSRLLEVFGLGKVTTGYVFITEYYSGHNATGGIPTDILTLGMRQFGMFGLLFISFILAKIISAMDRVVERIHNSKFYFMTLRVVSMSFLIVPYGDIDSFIRNRFDMIFIFIFMVIINRTSDRKRGVK